MPALEPVAGVLLTRRFPGPGWAWPRGDHDLLIKAVLGKGADRARAAALAWLDRNDIDDATFRDHRLLAALCERHGREIAFHPAYPRLAGLQRHLWARSQMASREIKPVLAGIAARGVAIMLLKGASRVALAHEAQKGRFAQDIDIVVRSAYAGAALGILEEHGWVPADGSSLALLRARLGNLRSRNFVGERLGDLDLHTQAYHAAHHNADDEERLWRHASACTFEGVPVLVPSAADRAALAIAHGALDAHTHSDWLTDCIAAITADDMNWETFAVILRARRLKIAAAIALSYMAQELDAPVPPALLHELVGSYRQHPLARLPTLIQAKPRMNMGPVLHGLRWLAKEQRKRAAREPDDVVTPVLKGVRRRSTAADKPLTGVATTHEISLTPHGDAMLAVTVRVAAPAAARRIEFELNGAAHHVARLRYRKLARGAGTLDIHYRGRLRFDAADGPFMLEARPLRALRDNHGAADEVRYGALSFQIVALDFS